MNRTFLIGVVALIAGAGMALAFPWPVPNPCPTNVTPSALGMAAKFVVVNDRDVDLIVNWIAPSGYEYLGGIVEPNETGDFPSYVGLRHVVRKTDGTCMGVYRAPFGIRFTGD